MTASTYDEALARVLAHEGGYVNHPSDPGGPTNHGITLAEYAAFKGRKVTAGEVRAMPLADAKAIYRAKYWARMCCDQLPAGLDYALFDYGVNSGIGRAPKVLQRLCGLPDDGKLSDAAIAAVKKHPPKDLIHRLCDERLAFLQRLKTWPTFGAGWRRRVTEVRVAALRMAAGADNATSQAGASAPAVSPAPGKGVVAANSSARNVTAGGIVVAGAAAAQQAHHAGASRVLLIVILAATLAAAVAVWSAWRWWHRRSQDAAVPAAPVSQLHKV